MPSIRRKTMLRFLVATALVGAGFVGTSEATTISVLPNTQTFAPGATVSEDIVVSGLGAGDTVGGFSFLLSWDSSILGAPQSFVNDPDHKMGALPLDLSDGFTGGGSPLSIFFLADGVISEPALRASEENDELMPIQVGEQQATGHGRPTVLICDDEARLGALTAGLLTDYGFSPITVGTGEAALDALDEGDPSVDVVLLDVNLSAGQSARDVLTAMKARGATARVILTSGLAEEDVDQDLVKHPFVVGYVAKPYGVDQLVQSINRALGL